MGKQSPAPTGAPGTLPIMDLPQGITMHDQVLSERIGCTPVAFASALLGKPVHRCCNQPASAADDFTAGCRAASACTIELEGRRLSTRPELGAAMAPIDSPAKALALASLTLREAWTPATPSSAADTARSMQWRVVDPSRKAFDVAHVDRGWRVTLPAYSVCGCDHGLWQVAFDVTADGSICPVGEPAPLASQSNGMCVD
jgi:hypothetical protein